MYFSGYDSTTNLALLAGAGLRVRTAVEETAEENGAAATFLWVVAERV